MHPRDLVATGQRYMVFKIPDGQLADICIPFLGSVARLFFIMPLYKAWDVLRRKRKSVIADSFDEFVVKGELNSISSDFVVSEHTGGFGVTFMPYSGPGDLVGFCLIVKTNPRGSTPGKANDKCIIQYL